MGIPPEPPAPITSPFPPSSYPEEGKGECVCAETSTRNCSVHGQGEVVLEDASASVVDAGRFASVGNPGSDMALAAGCICAVLDNCHGRFAPHPPDDWWITVGCPIHSPASTTTAADAASKKETHA